MITPYKDRELKPGDRVKVYRNLHKPGVTYSVRDARTGLVVAHATSITLTDVTFEVSAAGRAKVLATGVKNVHAFVVGVFDPAAELDGDGTAITYNPRKYASFVTKAGGFPAVASNIAVVDGTGVTAA